MDALQLLTADHNRVRGLFARFETAHEKDDQRSMIDLAATMTTELEVHTTIEEEIFYPAIRDVSDEVRELWAEAIEEHRVAKALLVEIGQGDPSDEQWSAKVKVLTEAVEHHAEEEEKEMFPKVRSAMDAAALEDLAVRMEGRKRELGAPTVEDKIDLTKEELLELARAQEIPGRSSMSQEELAATVAPR